MASDQDGRVGSLSGLGPRPDGAKRYVPAVEAGLILRPNRFHGLDPLGHDRHPDGRVSAVIGHFLAVPAGADAEIDPAAGEVVDTGHLLGRDYRVALDDETYGTPHPQTAGRRRRRRHGHEKVVGMPVFTW